MHNFVLACTNCNRSKSDRLAAKVHLDRWIKLTSQNSVEIIRIGDQVGVSANLETSLAIANWGYMAGINDNGLAWVTAGNFELINHTHQELVNACNIF
jgi:hypothetical protein